MKKITAMLLALFMLIGVLAGCGKQSDDKTDKTDKTDKLSIVTTIFPEYDWVKEILGDKADNAEITMLLDNGVDLHSYQPTADDIVKISDCNLFIYVGGESDGWVDDALKNATNKDMKVINLLEVLGDSVKEEETVEGIEFSKSERYMEDYLRRKGYITDFTGRHWKLRLPQYEHFTRLDTLDKCWTPENIQRSMGSRAAFGSRRAFVSYPPEMPQELREWFQPFHRTSHIYRLYLHYCYLLGYLPKNTDYKPTSPYLKEDLRKLDELSEQVRYMGKYGIETLEDLYADRAKIESDMTKLIEVRTKLQNKIRRAAPAEKETLRLEKAGVTKQITSLRKQLKLNKGIEKRSVKIQEKTDLLYANEHRAKEAQQKKKTQRREREAR